MNIEKLKQILKMENVPDESIAACDNDYDELIELLLEYCDNAETKYPEI